MDITERPGIRYIFEIRKTKHDFRLSGREEGRIKLKRMVNQAIYERLKQTARERSFVYYDEIAAMAGLNMDCNADRSKLGRLLMDISRYTHQAGGPLLSVLVVNRDSRLPNKGFFYAARELGRYEGHSASEALFFFTNELKAVHAHWARQEAT